MRFDDLDRCRMRKSGKKRKRQQMAEAATNGFDELLQRNQRSCAGKEKLLAIIMEATLKLPEGDHCNQLPSWSDVVSLNGDKPVVHGLETCQQYRDAIQGLGLGWSPTHGSQRRLTRERTFCWIFSA
jgi:hypothetical protein